MYHTKVYTSVLFTVALLGVLLAGCRKSGVDDLIPGAGGKTYLQFSMTGIHPQVVTTRAQGDQPSIHTDTEDYEDYVGEIAVLIYEASSGSLLKSYFTTYQSFVMELEPDVSKRYHFCFVANYPKSWRNTLESLHTYDALRTTLREFKDFGTKQSTGGTAAVTPLYDGASEDNLFPMSRIYENQSIPRGGSETSPIPFNPTVTASGSLTPISSWTTDKETGTTQQFVNLVRTSAKVSLNVSGEGLSDITKIELCNVASKHSFMESTPPNDVALSTRTFRGSDVIMASSTSQFQTEMYVPERIMGSADNVSLGWNGTDHPIGTPMYLKISMKSGMRYFIPVITAKPDDWAVSGYAYSYIDMARNTVAGKTANYSIVRNRHYNFDVIVPADDKELAINYQVLPWNLVESELSYARPQYNFVVTQNGQKLTDIYQEVIMNDDKDYQPTSVEISFSITAPKGALWTATITNGKDFVLTGDVVDMINEGIVTGAPREYKMKITPRVSFDKQPRFTQFYITVEGKEIYLGYDKITGQIVNRFISDGSARKWQFKQAQTVLDTGN